MALGLVAALLLGLGGGSELAPAMEQARARQLHRQRDWHLLLHYRVGDLGSVSDADDPGFFLDADGKTDPAAELRATLRGIFEPVGDPEQHPQCRFPARTAWLRRELGLTNAPRPSCTRLQSWLAALRPGRLTFVFAAAFLGSPPSMFGHTLLRVDRRDAPDDVLLATIIHFGGHPDTDNPLLYAWRGLTGGFGGRFSSLPYYLKVQEYTDLDQRDLWEYELALSPAQIERLLLHTWELGGVRFDYFFIDENCSYQILALLDVADPSRHLTDDFRRVAIPSDTARALTQRPGLVSNRRYRPALSTTMNARRELLHGEEVDLVESIVDEAVIDEAALAVLAPERRALVLEAAHDYLKFRHPYAAGQDLDGERPERDKELEILRRRGLLDVSAPAPEVPVPTGPEEGHGSSRVGIDLGMDATGELFTELNWRLGLHDLLDRASGYVPDSEIEVADLHLRFSPRRLARPDQWPDGITVERLDLIRIISITPRQGWLNAPSWRVALGGGRVADLGCAGWQCFAADLEAGVGYALATHLVGREVYYAFVDLRARVGPVFEFLYQVGAGASAGLLLQPLPWWRLQVEIGYRYTYEGKSDGDPHRLAISAGTNVALRRNLAMRIRVSQVQRYRELALGFLYYYD